MTATDMAIGDRPPSAGETGTRLAVEIAHQCEGWRDVASDDLIEKAARAAFASQGVEYSGAEISILLTDDAEIRALNGKWRDKDTATNVLSFPLDEPHGISGDVSLGDVVLALETVRHEADQKGIPSGHHAAHLVIHGVLHLLGHDHAEDDEADKMEALETEIMLSIGLPDPYAVEDRIDGEPR